MVCNTLLKLIIVSDKRKKKKYFTGSIVKVVKVKPDYRTKMSAAAKNKEVIYYQEDSFPPAKETDEFFLRKNIMN